MAENLQLARAIMQKLNVWYKKENMFIGGSLGLEMFNPEWKQTDSSDIDIFIISEDMFCIETICDTLPYITEVERIDHPYGYFEGQYARAKCKTSIGVKVDLIFLDTTITSLIKNMASDLSKFFYYLNSDNESFSRVTTSQTLKAMNRLIVKEECYCDEALASPHHIAKIVVKCLNFGLHYVTSNEGPQTGPPLTPIPPLTITEDEMEQFTTHIVPSETIFNGTFSSLVSMESKQKFHGKYIKKDYYQDDDII